VLHGIEEVMHADDCVILVQPFAAEIDRYQKVLAAGVGLRVVAIAQEETPFPTFRLPACLGFDRYLQLMAGWRLLTAAGQLRGIDIDRTARARKVGNAVDAPA
jgi:glucosamine--fructose-6-phosphate aminotransferase (isomerizing)